MFHPLPRTAVPFAALVVCSVAAAADPAVSWHTDYPTARKEAEEKKLPLLVVIGTDNCLYCRKQEATTFAEKESVALLAGKFVLLKLDGNKDVEFAKAMKVTVYPTTVIADTGGKVYAYLSGYVAPDQFREHTNKALGLIASADKEKNGAVVAVKPDAKKADAKELLAQAQAAYKGERYAECLERAEAVVNSFPNTPDAETAGGLVAAVRNDPDKLSKVGEQLDDKFASAYLSLGETWESRGKMKEAMGYFEKVIQVAPMSKAAEVARLRMAVLIRAEPALKAVK